jgi:peptide/nickel transport system permease protein
MIVVISFLIMELPPGDALTREIQRLEGMGVSGARQQVEVYRSRYALDQPVYARFFNWISRFVRGDYGESIRHHLPVKDLIGPRILNTIILALTVIAVSWGIGIPLGVYSATHQYTWQDHFFTGLTFIGLGLPPFLLALFGLVAVLAVSGSVLTGLFSSAMETAPWSFAKFIDLLKHLWLPVSVAAVTGTAWVLRVMRGNLLDELRVNYVQATRSKGVPERIVIWKHAVRNALHPLVMAFGTSFTWTISAFAVTSVVLDLPTIGPIFLQATLEQDIYLAGTILVGISVVNVMGNLMADVLLAWIDPRVRYD